MVEFRFNYLSCLEHVFQFLEKQQMDTFLLNKSQFFIDRPDETSDLLKYITGQTKDLILITGN